MVMVLKMMNFKMMPKSTAVEEDSFRFTKLQEKAANIENVRSIIKNTEERGNCETSKKIWEAPRVFWKCSRHMATTVGTTTVSQIYLLVLETSVTLVAELALVLVARPRLEDTHLLSERKLLLRMVDA